MATQLKCPNCGTIIKSDDINLDRLVAKCDQCHAIFDFDQQALVPIKKERPSIPLPEGLSLIELPNEMQIAISWRKTRHRAFFLTFTIIWNVITIPFVIIAVVSNDWTLALMISAHFIVGMGFLVYTLAIFMNSTKIDVGKTGITIVSKPINLPFHKNYYFRSTDLEQLYVEQYVQSTTNNQPNYAYRVNAKVEGRAKDIPILKGLKEEDQALFIEHEIEKYLHIEDKKQA